jgi:cytochrome bd-type quinol oxidase subunit 2
MSDYSVGFEYISDTVAHTGRFYELVAFEDSVIASAVIQNVTGNAFTGVPLKAGQSVEAVFTSVTLTSGKIAAYKI